MSVAGGAAEGAFKVNSLTGLDQASATQGLVKWDGARSLWNVSMLAGAVVLGPLTFTWGALLVFLLLAAVTLCAGHSVGFHRRLIHRSFEAPKWVDYVLMWLGTAVGIGGDRSGRSGSTTVGIGRNGSRTATGSCGMAALGRSTASTI